MKKPSKKNTSSLSAKAQKILREHHIDEEGPGTILKDFETLLDFVRTESPSVSKKNNLLPMKTLPSLNARMAKPFNIVLKRPRQKSFSNLHGLYLLFRSSGLSRVEGQGSKLSLALDDTVLTSWQSLNPTEKYFTLLEILSLRSAPETIGESRGGLWGNNFLFTWRDFFNRLPEKGMDIAGDAREETRLSYRPGLLFLALMELFGFVTIEHGEPEPGKGWRILSIRKTTFGEALLQIFFPSSSTAVDAVMEIIFSYGDLDTDPQKFGEFQPLLQNYFPEWQNNLELPHIEIREGTYTFKVSLGRAWRRIVIPGDFVLDTLSAVILNAFDFDHDHLYSFIYKNSVGRTVEVNHPYIDEEPYADKVMIQQVPLRVGASMTFLFDFGDNWEFNVQLEKIEPVDPQLKEAKVIESHGEAPEQYPNWEDEWNDWEEE